MSPVMGWREHLRRSYYPLHMGSCEPHQLTFAPLVESESMQRLDCTCCNGSAWVAWIPARDQGADPDDFVTEVEKIANDRSGQST